MDKYIEYLKSLEGKVIKRVTQPRDHSPVFIEFTDGTVTTATLSGPEEVWLMEEKDMAKTLKEYGWDRN